MLLKNDILFGGIIKYVSPGSSLLDFLLSPDSRDLVEQASALQAKQFGREKLLIYHAEFFAAGITAIIKRWLEGGCKESPEEIVEVLKTEYSVNFR